VPLVPELMMLMRETEESSEAGGALPHNVYVSRLQVGQALYDA
jgi:hypothetical protein